MDLVGKMTAIAGHTMKMLADFDAWLYVLLVRMEERLGLYKVARSISFTGDGYAYLLIAVLLLLLVPETGLAVTISGVVAFAMELPAYLVLKKGFRRRRPFNVVSALAPIHQPADEFSFPSGHAAAGFLMAYIVSHFFPLMVWPMYIWASLVGISRILLRVHFVSDVLAGIALGTGIAILSLNILGY